MAEKDKQFKDRLNDLLKRQGLSITEAAKRAKVSKKNLHNWSTGVMSTDYEGMSRVATVLGCSLEYLLLGKDSKKNLLDGYVRSRPIYDGLCEVIIRPLVPKGDDDDE